MRRGGVIALRSVVSVKCLGYYNIKPVLESIVALWARISDHCTMHNSVCHGAGMAGGACIFILSKLRLHCSEAVEWWHGFSVARRTERARHEA